MRTFLASLLLALATASAGAAQSEWPPMLEERVGASIAEAWETPAENVFLEWGLYRGTPPAPDAEYELLGTGRGGQWIVRMALPDGQTASVRLRAGRMVARPVAARRLERGEILGADDIRMESSVVWDAPKPQDTPSLEGWEVQRVIAEGEHLGAPALREPFAVEIGGVVTIVWTRGPIALSVPGKAAQSAVIGDEVLVRTDSGARIRGLVIAPGVVDISDALDRNSKGLSR